LAARRLNAALNDAGIPSSFFALENDDFELMAHEFAIKRTYLARLLSGVVVRFQAKLSSKILFTLVSTSAISNKKILALAKSKNTVFHIHNWYNLLSETQIYELSRSGFPVVITLHDQRLLTGGCHYSFECKKFSTGCFSCPNIRSGFKWLPAHVIKIRENHISRNQPHPWLTFISPSRWMETESGKSKTSSGVPNVFIPNVLGPSFGEPDLPCTNATTGRIRVGVASMDPSSYVKGGDIVSTLNSMSQDRDGEFELHFLKNYASSAQGVRDFWSQIDFLLVLSRADNSPNVIHEAHHFGIPVVASQVGGISELLIKDFDHPISLADMTAAYLSEYFNELGKSVVGSRNSKDLRNRSASNSSQAIQDYINMCSKFFSKGF